MKQNGKVRGARGVKTDARSTAAGILKAARRHGALAGAAARPRTAPSSVALRERDALHAAPRLAAAAPNRCFAGCRTARWRRRRGAAASALPPRPWATTIARRTCRLCRDRGGAVRLSHRLSRPLSRPTPALFVATPMLCFLTACAAGLRAWWPWPPQPSLSLLGSARVVFVCTSR